MTKLDRYPCPSSSELSAALASGAAESDAGLSDHLDRCLRCREERDALLRPRTIGRDLPIAALPPAVRESVRFALLAMPAVRSSSSVSLRAVAWGLPLAMAAGVSIFFLAHRRPVSVPVTPPAVTAEPAVRRGEVTPQGAVAFARVRSYPDEIVHLSEGTLGVAVQHLQRGERFRIVTADAEVEVRGTAFSVVARGDRLVSVEVIHGRVEVRPVDQPVVVLSAGEAWGPAKAPPPVGATVAAHRPESEAPAARTKRSHPTMEPQAVNRPRTAEHLVPRSTTALASPGKASGDSRQQRPPGEEPAPTPDARAVESELLFQRGWAALRAQDPARAAGAFDKAARAAGTRALAEDANFWHGIALLRAGKRSEARSMLSDFVQRYTESPRMGEASAALGWILLDEGNVAAAKARFAIASSDPVDAVRASGHAGLAAVAARSQPAK